MCPDELLGVQDARGSKKPQPTDSPHQEATDLPYMLQCDERGRGSCVMSMFMNHLNGLQQPPTDNRYLPLQP